MFRMIEASLKVTDKCLLLFFKFKMSETVAFYFDTSIMSHSSARVLVDR